MKATSLNDLKKELQLLPSQELAELCIALAKYKKDNKEYLGYLLFESHDKAVFANEVKAEIDLHFTALKLQNNLYLIKKSLRRILRIIGKYSKYVNDKAVAAELYIHFCSKMKNAGIAIDKSQLLVNMYTQQLKKINTLVASLHEDLQSDYAGDIERLKR